MRKRRYTEAQIVAILQELDAGRPAAELVHKHGAQIDALRLRLGAALGEAANAYVFTSATGKPISRAVFYRRVWRPLLDRAAAITERYARMHGRPDYQFPRIRPYDMRHAANALMAYLGIPIQVASRRMGHASI